MHRNSGSSEPGDRLEMEGEGGGGVRTPRLTLSEGEQRDNVCVACVALEEEHMYGRIGEWAGRAR